MHQSIILNRRSKGKVNKVKVNKGNKVKVNKVKGNKVNKVKGEPQNNRISNRRTAEVRARENRRMSNIEPQFVLDLNFRGSIFCSSNY